MTRGAARFAQASLVGDSDASYENLALAEDAGEMLGRRGITLITGGRGGVMEAAARGAAGAGGLTVGIVPGSQTAAANEWCDVVIPTGLGHARNVLTALAGDFIVAVGGGAGTLSELCFAWIHGRPIYVLPGSGGWSDRLAGGALDHRASSVIVDCDGVAALEREVVSFCAAKGLRLRERDTEGG